MASHYIYITNIRKCATDINSSCLCRRSDEEYGNLIKCKILDQKQADCIKTTHNTAYREVGKKHRKTF